MTRPCRGPSATSCLFCSALCSLDLDAPEPITEDDMLPLEDADVARLLASLDPFQPSARALGAP